MVELRVHAKPLSDPQVQSDSNSSSLVGLLQELRQLMQVIVKDQIMQVGHVLDDACVLYFCVIDGSAWNQIASKP